MEKIAQQAGRTAGYITHYSRKLKKGKITIPIDDELNDLLWENETVEKYIDTSDGELISTNKRLFLASKGFFSGITVESDIYYSDIKGIDYGKGIFSGWIEIHLLKGKLFRFDNVDNDNISDFSEHIKRIISKKQIDKMYNRNKSSMDYTGKTIKAFYFKGSKYDTRQWKELMVKILDILYERHTDKFNKILDIGKKRRYFTYDPEKLDIAEEIKNTGIYMETKLSANNIVRICYDIIKIFGYPYEDLIIEIE